MADPPTRSRSAAGITRTQSWIESIDTLKVAADLGWRNLAFAYQPDCRGSELGRIWHTCSSHRGHPVACSKDKGQRAGRSSHRGEARSPNLSGHRSIFSPERASPPGEIRALYHERSCVRGNPTAKISGRCDRLSLPSSHTTWRAAGGPCRALAGPVWLAASRLPPRCCYAANRYISWTCGPA